jgi:hypothetical protein
VSGQKLVGECRSFSLSVKHCIVTLDDLVLPTDLVLGERDIPISFGQPEAGPGATPCCVSSSVQLLQLGCVQRIASARIVYSSISSSSSN